MMFAILAPPGIVLAVVIEVASLAECLEVAHFVVGHVMVEVGYGEDDNFPITVEMRGLGFYQNGPGFFEAFRLFWAVRLIGVIFPPHYLIISHPTAFTSILSPEQDGGPDFR